MKKYIILTLAILSVFLFTGCSDATADISDKNTTLFTIGNTKYTTGDLYDDMLDDDSGNAIVNMAMRLIAEAEIETTDEITEAAQELYDSYVETMEESFDSFLEGIQYYGYEDEEEFMEYCVSVSKAEALLDLYVDENWDDLMEEYQPIMARIMFFDASSLGTDAARENAQAALDAVAAGESFATVAEEYSDDTDLAEETLYFRSSADLDDNVLEYLLTCTTTGLSDIITNEDSDGYYIVQVTNINYSQMKDDIVAELEDDDDFSDSVYRYYFQKHEFTIYDIDVYNDIVDNYSNYFVQTTGPNGSDNVEDDD